MIKIIKVTGSSLSPFFNPGDFVLTWRAPRQFRKLIPGDTVVFDHSVYGRMIKKVTLNNPAERTLAVRGSHPDSLPAQKIGLVPYQNIIGKVFYRIRR